MRQRDSNNFKILQAIHTATVKQQQDREEDRQDINALKFHNIETDKCEVFIYGLPLNSSLTFLQAASKLVSILSLSSTYASESTLREWTARDRLVESAPALRFLKANDIFGEGGRIPVYIRPLWPPAVHKLFTLAIRSSTQYGFARPTVVNRVVCLRQTFRSPLIPIYSENDLYRILPTAQSRASNHISFASSSTSNKGTYAPLLAPPQPEQ